VDSRCARWRTLPAILLAVAPTRAQLPTEAELEYFEAKVRPILAQHCFECHSERSKRVKGGLKLDSRASVASGGDSGAVVVAGDPESSALIEAVRYQGLAQMPPKGKLDAQSIATLEEWVRRGAYFPEGSATPQEPAAPSRVPEEPWSFAALSDPAPPDVRAAAWCRNEIDRFVLAELEARGLAPAPEADRRTLLRRLSYDLIGLPPTEDELAQFESDARPDAWQRQIERLLASPHYGERWGRAWLDLARYSDSNGLDENLAMSNAWRYRDWVVRALNQDLPYDQFLTFQLAGDLLPEPADDEGVRDQLAATGFLVLGPKMLAEQDKEKLVWDVVDEQLDVAFRAFQGLTVGCARCHDHKFDPLSQRDYYALAGVFKSTATMANLDFVSRWSERELGRAELVAARRAHVAATDAARRELEAARAKASEQLARQWSENVARYLLAGTEAARRAILVEAEESSRGNLIADREQYGSPDVVIARTGKEGTQFAEFDLTFARAGRVALQVRMAARESRPLRVELDGAVITESALGATTGSWNPDGQRWFDVATLDVKSGRSVLRFERTGAMPHLDKLIVVPLPEGRVTFDWPLEDNPWAADLDASFVRGWACAVVAGERQGEALLGLWSRAAKLPEAEFESRAQALFTELRVESAAGKLAWNSQVLALLDGLPPASLRELAARYQVLIAGADVAWREKRKRDAAAQMLDDPALEALRLVVHGPASPFRIGANDLEDAYGAEERAVVDAQRARVEELEAAMPKAFDSAPGVRDAEQVADVQLLRRGNHLDKTGEALARGTPEALADLVPSPAIETSKSGRLELARWMTDSRHPLTARVAVNRIWQGHFGRGLVGSSSNFGARGDAPTHPALLDWLARELQLRGWSQKALHRLICDSAAYRMASDASAVALERDPENRLLTRQNRRRLEAELVRDTLLARSGELDRTVGGTLLATENGGYVTNDQSNNGARYDQPRRSLYLPIIRNAMLDLFSAFDYPDPSVTVEARPETTSPSQALYLMNSPLVIATSRRIAEQTASASSDAERVRAIYRRTLAREPEPREVARALRFVGAPDPLPQPPVGADVGRASVESPATTADAWRALAQALLVSNEALYVD
jgi:hypothetical protein